MTCPKCSEDCGLDNECSCSCHEEEEVSAVVYENQTIEYESERHTLDNLTLDKTRIVVTGRTSLEAYTQFNKVLVEVRR